MSRTRTSLALSAFFLSLILILAGCSNSADSADASGQPGSGSSGGGLFSRKVEPPKPVTVPAGTELVVMLDHAVSSEQQKSGDSFSATVSEPIVVAGKTIVPSGARVKGTVVSAKASGRLKGVAQLTLTLREVEVDGKEIALETNSFARTGQNHNKRNVVAIGGGAGVGALIGGIAGGGKGAAIGAAVGAGAGTAGAAATGKKDITLPAETRIHFTIEQPIQVPVKS